MWPWSGTAIMATNIYIYIEIYSRGFWAAPPLPRGGAVPPPVGVGGHKGIPRGDGGFHGEMGYSTGARGREAAGRAGGGRRGGGKEEEVCLCMPMHD